MNYQGYPWIIWRVFGEVPCWRIMIHEHHLRIYKTLLTHDPKIAEQARHARDRSYQLKFAVSGEGLDQRVTSVQSLEPVDNDYIPM